MPRNKKEKPPNHIVFTFVPHQCERCGLYVWLGKMYSKKTPYLDMPWEIEAFSKQELILRRAFEE